MEFTLQKSTQFKVNELVVVTKAGSIDISSIFDELNIHDSILMPVMSGSVLVTDAVGLSGKLSFNAGQGNFVLPSQTPPVPVTGSAYFSGSALYIYNGTSWLSTTLS